MKLNSQRLGGEEKGGGLFIVTVCSCGSPCRLAKRMGEYELQDLRVRGDVGCERMRRRTRAWLARNLDIDVRACFF